MTLLVKEAKFRNIIDAKVEIDGNDPRALLLNELGYQLIKSEVQEGKITAVKLSNRWSLGFISGGTRDRGLYTVYTTVSD